MALIRARRTGNGRSSSFSNDDSHLLRRKRSKKGLAKTSHIVAGLVAIVLLVLLVVVVGGHTQRYTDDKTPLGRISKRLRQRRPSLNGKQDSSQEQPLSEKDPQHDNSPDNPPKNYRDVRERIAKENLIQEVEMESIDEPRDNANNEEPPNELEAELEEEGASGDAEKNAAAEKRATMPPKPDINFCNVRRPEDDSDIGYAHPAVIVLGVEDTSSNLVWHVLQQLFYPDQKKRVHKESSSAVTLDYDALGNPDDNVQNRFWNNISVKSHGKWIPRVFCQQQEEHLPTGFTWLSSPDYISENAKAQETLQLIKEALPAGSVKIIRLKRNYLDVLIRHEQVAAGKMRDPKVKLDHHKVLSGLIHLQKQQLTIDTFLANNEIPVLELDFEALFPFDHWTHMVKAAQATQDIPDILNERPTNSLLGELQEEIEEVFSGGSPLSQLESSWRNLLNYVGITQPTTLFHVFQLAMRTHDTHSFWIQEDAIENFAKIKRTLSATQYESSWRHQELDLSDWGGNEM